MPIDFSSPAPDFISVRIYTPTAHDRCLIIGEMSGVWIHWMGKRSLPCLGKSCPKARHGKPCRWVGYIPITVWNAHESKPRPLRAILALTAQKWQIVQNKLVDLPTGKSLQISVDKNPESRQWRIADLEFVDNPFPLLTSFRVSNELLRIWGIPPDTLNTKEGTE